MLELILWIVAIYIIYKVIKNKKPKPSAFDLFLMEKYEESKRRAELIPDYVPKQSYDKTDYDEYADNNEYTDDDDDEVSEKNKNIDKEFIKDLYLGMIKCNKYDTDGLKKEAMKMLNVNEEQLNEMLKKFKPEK